MSFFCSSANKDRNGNTTFFFHKLCKVPSIWSNLNLNTHHASSLRIGFDIVSILLGAKIMLSRNNTDTYLITQYLKQYFTGLKRNIAKHIRDHILLIQQFKHMFLVKSLKCLILPMFGEPKDLFIMLLRKLIPNICTIMFWSCYIFVKIWFYIDVLYKLSTYIHLPYHLVFVFTLLCVFNFVKNVLWQCVKMQNLPSNELLFQDFSTNIPSNIHFIIIIIILSVY